MLLYRDQNQQSCIKFVCVSRDRTQPGCFLQFHFTSVRGVQRYHSTLSQLDQQLRQLRLWQLVHPPCPSGSCLSPAVPASLPSLRCCKDTDRQATAASRDFSPPAEVAKDETPEICLGAPARRPPVIPPSDAAAPSNLPLEPRRQQQQPSAHLRGAS